VSADQLRDPTPLPTLVYRALRRELAAGTYEPGSKLPSEAELCRSFGVSRVTVREALKMLERDGVVVPRHGRGHFVRGSAFIREPVTELRGVTELLKSLGYEVKTRVLDVEHIDAGPYAEQLVVPEDARVVRVSRVRSSGDDPLIYSIDVVPEELLGGDVDFESSLVDALSRRGHDLAYSQARIRAGTLTPIERRRIGGDLPALWLVLDQVNHSGDDLPLMVSHDYHRGDRFEFNVLRRRTA
jgi:GntR family transcriptional regulator